MAECAHPPECLIFEQTGHRLSSLGDAFGLGHFPIVPAKESRLENALALCFGAHFNPTGDPNWGRITL